VQRLHRLDDDTAGYPDEVGVRGVNDPHREAVEFVS
jgi:hypothetical protein